MSILVNENTRIIVQGITEKKGEHYTLQMLKDGTNIVAGVAEGKQGASVGNIPIYHSLSQCLVHQQANAVVIFNPPASCSSAILEAIESRIPLIICITDGIPIQEMIHNYRESIKQGCMLIGPGSPGIISPGQSNAGIWPAQVHKKGSIGIVSRSTTLTSDVACQLAKQGFGISTSVGIGHGPVIGTSMDQILSMFESDPQTEAIVLIGRIGGNEEEKAARFILSYSKKPVISYITGRSIPLDKLSDYTGSSLCSGRGHFLQKVNALKDSGVTIACNPEEIPDLLSKKLQSSRS